MSLITALFDDEKARARFWEKVYKPEDPHKVATDCWVWMGSMDGRQPRYHRHVKQSMVVNRSITQHRTIVLSPARIAYILHHREQNPDFDLTEDVDIARHKFCTMTRECMNPNHMFTRKNGKLGRGGAEYDWRFVG